MLSEAYFRYGLRHQARYEKHAAWRSHLLEGWKKQLTDDLSGKRVLHLMPRDVDVLSHVQSLIGVEGRYDLFLPLCDQIPPQANHLQTLTDLSQYDVVISDLGWSFVTPMEAWMRKLFAELSEGTKVMGLMYGADAWRSFQSDTEAHHSDFPDMHALGDQLTAVGYTSVAVVSEQVRFQCEDAKRLWRTWQVLGVSWPFSSQNHLMTQNQWNEGMQIVSGPSDFLVDCHWYVAAKSLSATASEVSISVDDIGRE